jgi:hypothetical protein
MRCYIWGTNNREDRTEEGKGVACFAIPDWGLQFRGAQEGTAATCEATALLALLRFAEDNPKIFEGRSLDVYSDASQLIEQLNGRMPLDPVVIKVILAIRSLREKIRFELTWVPPDQNQAIDGILDLPPLKSKLHIDQSAVSRQSPAVNPRRPRS